MENCQKWSRYKGKQFSIGDADVHVENIGTFTRKTLLPKITVSKDAKNIDISDTETENYYTKFDVTKISDSATCATNDTLLLISEIVDEDWEKRHPRKVYIYSIDGRSDVPDNGKYTNFPSLERFKKDFETQTFQHCNSLLYEFCETYSLSRYNDNSDRIADFNLIRMNLDWLELELKEKTVEEEVIKSVAKIKIFKRKLTKN